MNFGVIHHDAWLTEVAGNGAAHIKTAPQFQQFGIYFCERAFGVDVVRGMDHDAVTDHPWHPYRDAIKGRQAICQPLEGGDQLDWSKRIRGRS